MRPLVTKRLRLMRAIKKIPGLVAYYPLNEVEGSVARNYARANLGSLNGTTTGATVAQPGKVGRAYSFDGVNDLIKVDYNSAFDITSAITIFGIANSDTLGTWDRILDKGDGDVIYELTKDNDNKMKMRVWIGGVEKNALSNSAISADTWYFFAGTYDGSEVAVYQNGVKQTDTTAATGNIDTNTDDLYIGVSTPGTNFDEAWSGLIQHVAVFNVALTSSEHLKLAKIAGLA